MSESTRKEIEARSIPRTWAAGAVIFRQNDQCGGLHILEAGAVKLFVAANGREQIMHIQSERGPLTLLPLLDGGPYSVSASALVRSRTRFLALAHFDELYETRPEFSRALLYDMATRMRKLIGVTDAVTLKPAISRVASYLLGCARESEALDTGSLFKLPVSQTELAHLCGTTRETVARALGELRAAGVIEQSRSKVRVLDEVGLVRFAQHQPPMVPS